jgi:lipoate-protein ligase A
VTNISEHLRHPIGMDAFRAEMVGGISDAFGELIEYQLTAEDREAVDRLAEKKYKSWDWTFGRSPEFAVEHKIGLDSGNVDARLIVKNGTIKDVELADQSAESYTVRNVINKIIGKRYDIWCLQR